MQQGQTQHPLTEYRGAIHIHTRFSDGSGGMKSVIAAARSAGLDFIIVTDHDTLAAKERGWEGWHDGLLVTVGVEISPPGPGHCLALDVSRCEGYETMPAPEYLAAIKAQGGLAFPAHPQGKTFPFTYRRSEIWTEWRSDTFAGIELWSYMQDWMDCLGIGELWGAIRHPEERIHGPGEAMLRRWDAMGRLRRVVGLAGLDAHARRLPLTWLRVFTYDYLFRTLRTHVMARPFVHRFEEDKAALREALEQGRCFMANDLPADATGFVFRGQKATGDPVLMGSETAWEPGFLLKVITPRHATLRLLCDGRIVCSKEGNYLAAPAERAGVYRAEAVLNGKPWIFSNPVYMR